MFRLKLLKINYGVDAKENMAFEAIRSITAIINNRKDYELDRNDSERILKKHSAMRDFDFYT